MIDADNKTSRKIQSQIQLSFSEYWCTTGTIWETYTVKVVRVARFGLFEAQKTNLFSSGDMSIH